MSNSGVLLQTLWHCTKADRRWMSIKEWCLSSLVGLQTEFVPQVDSNEMLFKIYNSSVQHRIVCIIQSLLFPWFMSIADSDYCYIFNWGKNICISKPPKDFSLLEQNSGNMSQETSFLLPLIQPCQNCISFRGKHKLHLHLKQGMGEKEAGEC